MGLCSYLGCSWAPLGSCVARLVVGVRRTVLIPALGCVGGRWSLLRVALWVLALSFAPSLRLFCLSLAPSSPLLSLLLSFSLSLLSSPLSSLSLPRCPRGLRLLSLWRLPLWRTTRKRNKQHVHVFVIAKGFAPGRPRSKGLRPWAPPVFVTFIFCVFVLKTKNNYTSVDPKH